MIFTCVEDGDRRGQMCRCCKCLIEAVCTPRFDFWESRRLTGHTKLFCENCWNELLSDYGRSKAGLR